MSWVVIVQTAGDKPLWPGLPEDYPVMCMEYADRESAEAAHPGKVIMTVESYRAFKAGLDEIHPNPMKLALVHSRPTNIQPLPAKSVWLKVWEWLCRLI